ncbi:MULTISPECIES: MFS transporter [Burkholderia]|uniref:MFS transporter n=1 Tax=Burkholderia paludis TaxID=1506587 RepID=A0A6J5EDN0_9BURK|nr:MULTISPECIES: MFS transporter [Burkholderia]CAB3763386.1 4-hydroxybenzoate transporter PcaK [Burkholderia paludis]VWB32093.1 MFS transporter [Burkholderia paludis]
MQIDLSAVIDDARFGPFQVAILALCCLIVTIDGYDLVVMGVALPTIISDMKMDAHVAGMIASCALVGMMVGAIAMGALADRIGRIRTIAACVALFSLFTAASGLARDPVSFAALRLIAGVGLGGVIPCVTATVADYAPRRLRARLTTIVLAGYPLGGVLAAWLGKHLVHAFGWQSVFFVAGTSLLLLPAVFKLMPESPAILQRRRDTATLRAVVRRIAPTRNVSDTDEIRVPSPVHRAKAPVALLFRDNRGFSTLMLWLGYFSGLFMLYGLNAWLPRLMALAGFSLDAALTFLLLMNAGSIAGSFAGGWLADRFGLKRIMMVMLTGGAIAIAIAAHTRDAAALSIVIFIVGMTASGVQGVANAYVAQFYPADIRSTGIGMTLGIGRLGGIASPIAIGLLLSLHLPVQHVLHVVAAFCILQAIAMWLVDDRAADFARARSTSASAAHDTPGYCAAGNAVD